ncbi:MAG: type VII toxin-antitoxin system MntA family adenylyltransferase antitoxin [Anaerolineales bacterium]
MEPEIEALLERIVAWAEEQEEIIAVYLYGSYAQGRATALSDVDIAVLTRPIEEQRALWRLEDHWSSQWPSTVDLHVLNLAPLPFRYEVIANGKRLWAADSTVVSQESLILRRYWDERPRLDYIWRQHVRHTLEQKDETEYQEYQDALAKVRTIHQRVRETADDPSTKF